MSDRKTPSENSTQSSGSDSRSAANPSQIQRRVKAGSWFRLLPRDTLVLLAFVAGILGLLMVQLENVNRLPFWMMVIFFAIMVWMRSAMALACFFIVLGAVKFSEPFGTPHWVDERLDLLHASDIVFTILVLAFAGTCFRFLETRKYCLGILSKFGWGVGSVDSKKKSGKSTREFPSLLGGRWWLIPVSIAAAFLLLGFFPLDRGAVRKYWIKPEPARLMFLIGILFLVWFLIRNFFMLVMRWKMDEDQAGVHVRSVFAKEFWREHRAIEARRAKANTRKNER